MIALTCHIYFDVPSEDHMLLPYPAWHERGCKFLPLNSFSTAPPPPAQLSAWMQTLTYYVYIYRHAAARL